MQNSIPAGSSIWIKLWFDTTVGLCTQNMDFQINDTRFLSRNLNTTAVTLTEGGFTGLWKCWYQCGQIILHHKYITSLQEHVEYLHKYKPGNNLDFWFIESNYNKKQTKQTITFFFLTKQKQKTKTVSLLAGILSQVDHKGLHHGQKQCSICHLFTLHVRHQTTNYPKTTKSVLT